MVISRSSVIEALVSINYSPMILLRALWPKSEGQAPKRGAGSLRRNCTLLLYSGTMSLPI